jgi:diguanylate cyclase (GGDEF)-like protein
MAKRSAGRSDAQSSDSADELLDPGSSKLRLFGPELSRDPNAEEFRSLGGQAVLVVTGNGTIAEVLQAPDIADGAAPSALIDTDIDELWPGDTPGRLKASVKRAIRSRQVQSSELATSRDDAHYDFVFIPHGRDRVMVVARDVSARKSAYSRMQRLAYLDDVTKLPNRQFLFEELSRCTDLLRLQEGRAAVLCVDVATGENSGNALNSKQQDAIYVELASRLTHELRGVNQPDIDDYERYSVAARIEHRQFGIILPIIESGADAEGVAQRLIDTLQQPIKLAHKEARVTARIGIALFPQDGKDAETLYSNALAAMEDARNNQAGPYKFHSGTVRLRALQRQDLELELRAALERDEFAIEFLPIVDAATRRVACLEALLRWPQNVFGGKSIQKVIGLAENTGLILPIGDWVLRKSCEALRNWHAAGWLDLRISVNLSVQEFSREDLVERVDNILRNYSLDPHCLDLEITEFALFRDAMKNYSVCNGLRDIGVAVVVDDYGTGACSLAHVARSPVAAIKIDNSFVANAVHDEHDRAACAAITAMARQLGKRIIAEGVETEDQAQMLQEQGCDAFQGFLICRPSSAASIDEFLNRQASADDRADEGSGP